MKVQHLQVGLPISQRFFEEFDRKEILKEFGLKENLKTVIFFAGGRMGLARKNIFEYVKVLADNSKDVQIVAISGKNEKAYKKFKEIAEGKENVKVIEFTNKVPELMSVADLAITKPRRNNRIRSINFKCTNTCDKSNTRTRRRERRIFRRNGIGSLGKSKRQF